MRPSTDVPEASTAGKERTVTVVPDWLTIEKERAGAFRGDIITASVTYLVQYLVTDQQIAASPFDLTELIERDLAERIIDRMTTDLEAVERE